jgi:AcrR family transcriptional regulator
MKPPAGRVGRPPRESAGEVDERILGAARRVFLERGLARAGKPTIYARFSNKKALFAAVMLSNVAATAARFEGHVPTGSTLDQRLVGLGAAIVYWVLAGETVAVMRVGISEARRLPDLAINVHLTARRRGEEIVSKLLAEAAQSDAFDVLPAFAPERLATTTKFFIDLVVWPILVRALFGEKLKDLRAEVEADVARSVAFFLAACRHGGIS